MPDSYALVWDQVGTKQYETGVDHGVLFPWDSTKQTPGYGDGVAWSGLTGVTESPSGAEPNKIYADNIEYLNLISAEEFGATIEAYSYPDEFAECDGSAQLVAGVTIGQQPRKMFGFSYRTKIGNDISDEAGYKIHLIYGAKAAPSERAYATVNDSPEAITFSWEISTTPVAVAGFKPTAHVEIDSTKTDSSKLEAFKAILYGSGTTAARLPLPDEVKTLLT